MKQNNPKVVLRSSFELTDNENEELRQAFNLFDKNGSGTISSQEIRVALTALGFSMTNEEIQSLILKYDHGKYGEISFDEFTEIIQNKISQLLPKEQLIRAFHNLDSDRNGTISLTDLIRMSESLGEEISRDELREIIMSARGQTSNFDIHTKDVGEITQQEFVAAINKNFI